MALNLTSVLLVGILLLGLLAYTRLAQRLDHLGASRPSSDDALVKLRNEVGQLQVTVEGLGAKEPPVPRVLLGHMHQDLEGWPEDLSGGLTKDMPLKSLWRITDPHGVVLLETTPTDWWAEQAEESAAYREATRDVSGEDRYLLGAPAKERVIRRRAGRIARTVFPVFTLHQTDCGYDILL